MEEEAAREEKKKCSRSALRLRARSPAEMTTKRPRTCRAEHLVHLEQNAARGIRCPAVSSGAAASWYLKKKITSIQRGRAQTRVGGEVVSRLRVRWVMYPGGGPHETMPRGQGSREMGGHRGHDRGQIAPVGHPHPHGGCEAAL